MSLLNFLVRQMQLLADYEGMRQLFIKNILIRVPKMNESLTGLEQHEGE